MTEVAGSLNQTCSILGAVITDPLSHGVRVSKRKHGSAFNTVLQQYGERRRNKQKHGAAKIFPSTNLLTFSKKDEELIFLCVGLDKKEEDGAQDQERCSGGVADNKAILAHQLDCDEAFENLLCAPTGSYDPVLSKTQVQKAVSQDLKQPLSMDQLEALVNRESVLAVDGHTITLNVIAKLDKVGFGPAARQRMVSWLMKVQSSGKLSLLCLATAVHLLYRFLSRAPSAQNHLNLVVLTCLWVSSKLHETHALTLDYLSAYLPKENSIEDMLACERLLTKTLNFRLVCSTALEVAHQTLALSRDLAHSSPISTLYSLSSRPQVKINSEQSVKKYMHYILDSCLLDEQNWKFRATTKGAASVLAAHEFVNIDCTHLRTKVEALNTQHMAALPLCEQRFRNLLKQKFGRRAVSPISIFGVTLMP